MKIVPTKEDLAEIINPKELLDLLWPELEELFDKSMGEMDDKLDEIKDYLEKYPDIEALKAELKTAFQERAEKTKQDLQNSIQRLESKLEELASDEAFKDSLKGVQSDIAVKYTTLLGRINDKSEDFDKSLDSIKSLIAENSKISSSNKREIEDYIEDSLEKFEDDIEEVRNEIVSRLNNMGGGGNMNRQINVNSSVMSLKYTDINFRQGNNVTLTRADDDTNKRVNITIAASGGAGGDPAGDDTQVQFNDAGSFGAATGFTFNQNTSILQANLITSSVFLASRAIVTNASSILAVSETTAAEIGFLKGVTSSVVSINNTQTLANKTLVTPSIASFSQAQHNHQDGAGGGQLNGSSVFTMTGGQIPASVLGTGTAGTATFLRGDQVWTSIASGGSGTPGGNDTEVQFNNGGAFGASSVFTFNQNSSILLVARGAVLNGNTVNNTRPLDISNATQLNGLRITTTSSIVASRSVGGQLLVSNGTTNTGNAAVFYSNVASALGRIVHITADDPRFDKEALFVESDSMQTTTAGFVGNSSVQGVIKITHNGTGGDADASGLSIDIAGTGTAAQGIFVDASDGGTTGKLLNIRNNGIQKFVVESTGDSSVYGTLTVGQTGSIFGALDLKGKTSGIVRVQTASVAGNWTLTLPTVDGSAGQYLLTDGNGITQWASVTAAGGSGITRVTSVITDNTTAGDTAVTDYVFIATAGLAFTLPDAGGNSNLYTLKNATNSSVLVTAVGGDTIDGSGSVLVAINNQTLGFISDGTNYQII